MPVRKLRPISTFVARTAAAAFSVAAVAALATAAAHTGLAQAPVPRKAPEFTIARPVGDPILLSSFKGKVVLIEFMFVGSPHCIQLAQMLNTLQHDLGPRGYQSVAIAFGQGADQGAINHIAQRLGLSYPVGYTTSDKVDAFLGREAGEKVRIPQMILIDRQGFIRAASGLKADPSLESDPAVRATLAPLLDAPASSAAAKPAAK